MTGDSRLAAVLSQGRSDIYYPYTQYYLMLFSQRKFQPSHGRHTDISLWAPHVVRDIIVDGVNSLRELAVRLGEKLRNSAEDDERRGLEAVETTWTAHPNVGRADDVGLSMNLLSRCFLPGYRHF